MCFLLYDRKSKQYVSGRHLGLRKHWSTFVSWLADCCVIIINIIIIQRKHTPTCNSRGGSGCPERCCCKLLSPSADKTGSQGGSNSEESPDISIITEQIQWSVKFKDHTHTLTHIHQSQPDGADVETAEIWKQHPANMSDMMLIGRRCCEILITTK